MIFYGFYPSISIILRELSVQPKIELAVSVVFMLNERNELGNIAHPGVVPAPGQKKVYAYWQCPIIVNAST